MMDGNLSGSDVISSDWIFRSSLDRADIVGWKNNSTKHKHVKEKIVNDMRLTIVTCCNE